MQFITGSYRYQMLFVTLDTQVSHDNAARLIDAFIDKLDLDKPGFKVTVYLLKQPLKARQPLHRAHTFCQKPHNQKVFLRPPRLPHATHQNLPAAKTKSRRWMMTKTGLKKTRKGVEKQALTNA